ncbi:MAG: helix-hairpin-helix domain-containing protein [Chitinophagaceae bacterium]
MKGSLLILLFTIHYSLLMAGQELPSSTEQQLENQADADQQETEDDSYLQDLGRFRAFPVNLNTAGANELKQLGILNELQVSNLITYRNLFGRLLSIYELQAVACWDLVTIRKLLPFVTITTSATFADDAGKRFREGEHSFLIRISQLLEKPDGYKRSASGTSYLGSPQRILFRYRYGYKNLLQFGVLGDKDAGEQFLKGTQNKGFDFYSFHFFARKTGIIQALAFGDFTVNMGQGLIQWQGPGFKKSVDVMGVKRQSEILRPYNSAGEFYFHRGAGITVKKGKAEATIFISFRKLGGNLAADTLYRENVISSFLVSGYHRTVSENADRNNIPQTAAGGNITYRNPMWHIGINGVMYNFSLPVRKSDEPYNLYAISGRNWYNVSVDYSYTFRNFHFFGEAAADKHFSKALINGLLLSVDPRADISFVWRIISPAFQSINGNAFTENTNPVNEIGCYTGITIRPAPGFRFDAYADFFTFPWLKYLADAPGNGKDFLTQFTYTPNRQVELVTRFRNETKQTNQQENLTVTNYLVTIPKKSWRTQVNYKINPAITLRNRVELLWYDNKGVNKENGFLSFIDLVFKPLLASYGGVLRLQYFETDGYNSRIYAYENDVLYSYSIPAFSDKGFRYYFTLNYDPGKKLSCWLRWAQTIYGDKTTVGSGLDKTGGNSRTELKLQVRLIF